MLGKQQESGGNLYWTGVFAGTRTYSMIRRALELKQALNTYIAQLWMSSNDLDTETYNQDYLQESKWKNLEVIKD